METMKAILVERSGGPDNLQIKVVAKPKPSAGQVLIEVKAFGINRAELYMREGKWPEIAGIIGIECVGLVREDPSGTFRSGQKVAAIMGGMGRTINGSYAEFTCAPLSNVVPIDTELEWSVFASIPETFASAWGALHWALNVKAGQSLLVRGATSAFGQAAIILAKQAGLSVIAVTRSATKKGVLTRIGADHVIVENGHLVKDVKQLFPSGIDRVLDLIGSTTLMNSMKATASKGIVCMAGFLGGRTFTDRFQPFVERSLIKKGQKFSISLPGGVKLVFFASSAFGSRHFPVSGIPLQQIIRDIEENRIPSILSRTFRFEEIAEAHHLMERDTVNGKIVIVL